MNIDQQMTAADLLYTLSLSANPVAVYRGDNLIIEMANEGMLKLWGKKADVIGKPLEEALPELEGQPFADILKNIWLTGETYLAVDTPATLNIDGRLQTFFFDFEYKAVKRPDGSMLAILNTAVNVDARRETNRLAIENADKLELSNLDLIQSNEGLQEHNAGLLSSNIILTQSNEGLTDRNITLELLQRKLQEANEKYQIINEELQSINEEYQATNEELKVTNEELQKTYEEQQVLNEELSVTNEEILQIQNKLASANISLTESEERFRLAVESSGLATWYMNVSTGEIMASKQLLDFFGFDTNAITYDMMLNKINDEHRAVVIAAMTTAIEHDNPYDIEFSITNSQDSSVKWARATGKFFATTVSGGGTFFGAIDNITERKQDDQRKNDFIGMVSHELKTPLTSLGGFLQIAEDVARKKSDGFSVSLLERSAKQVDRMTNMINGFLNVSRFASGKIEINASLFDMADLVKESEEETRSLYSQHVFIFESVEPTIVSADHDKISQVVNNFISNAVKYSTPGTTITVSCVTADRLAKVCVADNGIGIAQVDIPKLFDRYYRVENNSTKSIAGFGIGLYLCAEIINRHGGKINVSSEEGKGSTFCFFLPVAIHQRQ